MGKVHFNANFREQRTQIDNKICLDVMCVITYSESYMESALFVQVMEVTILSGIYTKVLSFHYVANGLESSSKVNRGMFECANVQ